MMRRQSKGFLEDKEASDIRDLTTSVTALRINAYEVTCNIIPVCRTIGGPIMAAERKEKTEE